MKTRSFARIVSIGALVGVFAVGFLCGSITQRSASAQMGSLGESVMKEAGSSGGMLGSVAELGTSIVDMQKNVDALQKNIDTLKKIKAALGG